ncbi:MAG TPA: hypothetical protein VNX68_04210, partial [Nitrosopumilaceae archaeon]|nr:hypothetical protein [Nitrosopumilaceae archaeon]
LTLCFALPGYAQKHSKREKLSENHSPFGRKKKEKHNQRSHMFSKRGGLFHRRASKGNADAFASNSTGRRGFFSRLFSGGGTKNASLRKTKPGKVQNREQPLLFHRHRTHNKNGHERINKYQKKERDRKRVRGSSVFHKRKR